jgi:hypothetical protein
LVTRFMMRLIIHFVQVFHSSYLLGPKCWMLQPAYHLMLKNKFSTCIKQHAVLQSVSFHWHTGMSLCCR